MRSNKEDDFLGGKVECRRLLDLFIYIYVFVM